MTELKALTDRDRLYLRTMLQRRRRELLNVQHRTSGQRTELRQIKILMDKFSELEETR